MEYKKVTIKAVDLMKLENLHDLSSELLRSALYVTHILDRDDLRNDCKCSALRRLIECCDFVSTCISETQKLARQRLKELEG